MQCMQTYICFICSWAIHQRLKSNFPEEYSTEFIFLIIRSVADTYLFFGGWVGREISKFDLKAWRKYLFLKNLYYVTYLFLTYFLHQRVKKLFEKFLQNKKMLQADHYSCLMDSSRQGIWSAQSPKEINKKSEIKAIKEYCKECKISIHFVCNCWITFVYFGYKGFVWIGFDFICPYKAFEFISGNKIKRFDNSFCPAAVLRQLLCCTIIIPDFLY